MNWDELVNYLEDRLPAYLADLRTLVSIDSGSFDKAGNDAVVDFLEQRLADLGCAIERYGQPDFGDDLLATLTGRGDVRILLLGHTDTVFPAGTAAERPMVIEGDKILGPGTCDMKAGLLAALYAMEALKRYGFDGYGSLSFMCVSDEEIGGERHAIPLIRAQARESDVVLTLEAARENGDIVSSRKGMTWYTVEASGKAAHAGVEPEKGRNAIVALARQVPALDALNGLEPGVTVNVGCIEGGVAPNVVPDHAGIRIDLRVVAQASVDRFEGAVRDALGAGETPGVRFSFAVEEGSQVPPMERTPAVAELESLAQEAARSLGFQVGAASTGGSSDACFAAAEGAAVLDGLGPVGGLDHSPDEYVRLSSIVPRIALLARLIALASQEAEAGPTRA